MLRLNVAAPGSIPTRLPAGAPEVEEWREPDGTVSAVTYTVAGWQWMHLPEVGTFRFKGTSGVVTAYPEPSRSRELVLDVFHRCVLPVALQARGLEALHGSGIRGREGVVAFCAVAETGKSTLAYGLGRRGYVLWADDAVVFDSAEQGIRALPVPFRMRLHSASLSFFGEGRPPAETPVARDALPLAAVCVLERVPPSNGLPPVEITRVRASRALTRVLTHAYYFDLRNTARKRRMVQHYLDLIAQVPVYEARFQAGFDKLSAFLDTVERTILD